MIRSSSILFLTMCYVLHLPEELSNLKGRILLAYIMHNKNKNLFQKVMICDNEIYYMQKSQHVLIKKIIDNAIEQLDHFQFSTLINDENLLNVDAKHFATALQVQWNNFDLNKIKNNIPGQYFFNIHDSERRIFFLQRYLLLQNQYLVELIVVLLNKFNIHNIDIKYYITNHLTSRLCLTDQDNQEFSRYFSRYYSELLNIREFNQYCMQNNIQYEYSDESNAMNFVFAIQNHEQQKMLEKIFKIYKIYQHVTRLNKAYQRDFYFELNIRDKMLHRAINFLTFEMFLNSEIIIQEDGCNHKLKLSFADDLNILMQNLEIYYANQDKIFQKMNKLQYIKPGSFYINNETSKNHSMKEESSMNLVFFVIFVIGVSMCGILFYSICEIVAIEFGIIFSIIFFGLFFFFKEEDILSKEYDPLSKIMIHTQQAMEYNLDCTKHTNPLIVKQEFTENCRDCEQ